MTSVDRAYVHVSESNLIIAFLPVYLQERPLYLLRFKPRYVTNYYAHLLNNLSTIYQYQSFITIQNNLSTIYQYQSFITILNNLSTIYQYQSFITILNNLSTIYQYQSFITILNNLSTVYQYQSFITTLSILPRSLSWIRKLKSKISLHCHHIFFGHCNSVCMRMQILVMVV